MMNIRKLQSLSFAVRKAPTNENLIELVLMLADHVIELEREVDRLQHIANRADRNSRMGGHFR